jgi:hypothetical protein
VRATLSRSRLRFYGQSVGLFASVTGHDELALRYYGEGNDVAREQQDAHNLSIGLANEADLFVVLGRLSEAQHPAAEALRLAS